MLRKTLRERREYLFKKSQEGRRDVSLKKARQLKEALDNDKPIPGELRALSGVVQSSLDLLDAKKREELTHLDDEYAFAGIKDPKVLITTSRNPSSRLSQFAKEMRLIIPNSERLNRGSYILKDLVDFCRAKDVSDIVLLYEHRGKPDAMVVSHLPHGPTSYFQLSDVILRHDLPESPPTMSEAYPHLIFHNFTSQLGNRFKDILRYLFPPQNTNETRVLSFINKADRIFFRHHVWNETKIGADDKNVTLTEIGPRFTLKPFKIELGTVDMRDLEVEWTLRPYFNTHEPALSAA
ncbi:U3 small nucleolar ribonucleoprotein, putative [Theileria equi strain WA]|uniref:U3 small nucleolar ribonucleoprotein, putative n=1 Tax=Theileria equi strain WA TaxID=1537102 RepID=L0B086_THEEQ|nr:U3 small nucleolar ribonucleoprotein, putative [Theileria equi strain WA]AFZ80549.1 U3 small nucleolar ribonucleoprotein, putative [Theileria equi strain WA]|eukprot:XP_004830215.1 U3 small nucleolar ribonucleoprotein, putative [Theileria equi strain WA]